MNGQPSRLHLDLTCTVEAPRELVFSLLTTPAELAKWWGPQGFSTPEIELDLRVGGRYRFTMQPPEGEAFHLSGEFIELVPPARLGYTFRWEEPTADDRETVVTFSLDAVENGTHVSLSQGRFASGERLALHREGWTESFEKLRKVIGPGAAP
ncbi:SRPBCC domain-containing protein [Arthrobacter sp. GCM10027362]|uniref:SRPBCC family protein n=1 Tax=Arthrobacter sp. GCM10027362 TaxID=3273379 RepID=UPI0036389074